MILFCCLLVYFGKRVIYTMGNFKMLTALRSRNVRQEKKGKKYQKVILVLTFQNDC